MKVLVSAVACDPDGVSEGFVGWQAVSALASEHDVWVITTPRYRRNIERAMREGRASARLHFYFHGGLGEWQSFGLITRAQAWLEYVLWSRTLLRLALQLHARIRFDLTQHVTYSAWRVPSPLWRLGPPFVWGPLGGAGDVPLRFFRTMSFPSILFESLRKCAYVAAWLPSCRRCARNAAWVLASNDETEELIVAMRGSADGVSQMCPSYMRKEEIERFRPVTAEFKPRGALQIFAGGTLLGSKGIAVALHGLQIAAARGVEFDYTIACRGPESGFLRKLVRRLGLASRVRFVDRYDGEAYHRQLSLSHCFLMPSFRENLGLTMVEAMLARAVPIVADISAPGEIVTSACGIKLRVSDARTMAREVARAVEKLYGNPQLVATLGEAASLRAGTIMSARTYSGQLREIYDRVVRRSVICQLPREGNVARAPAKLSMPSTSSLLVS